MDFKLDDEQQMIVQTVRKFSDRDLRGWAADADRAGTPPDRLTPMASELGFFVDAVPAAIANAIYDAIGVRIKELPITPDKIIKGLKDKETQERGATT